MRKILIISVALLAVVTISSCWEDGSSFSISGDGEEGRVTISTHDESGYLKLESRGSISFTDDETAVKSISPGGYIKFRRNGKKMRVYNNSQGEVEYEMDGKKVNTLNADDKRFLAKAIKEMINSGFDAKGRIERVYAKGGTTGVFNAIDDLTSDWVKSKYFEYLLELPSLTQNELTTIARKIGTQLNSDYEKSNLLKKFSGDYLQDDATANAYLDAVGSISSDYEKAGALKEMLNHPLTPGQYSTLLNITDKIGSDYEKANVLKDLISQGIPDDNNMNKFLLVTGNVNSDYERSNVLQKVLDQGIPGGQSFGTFLTASANMGSDFERANVLKKLAAKNISSEDQWVNLISATEKIASEFDRSSTLIEIAKNMPVSDKVKVAYMTTAKTLTGDYDYGQAVKAVR